MKANYEFERIWEDMFKGKLQTLSRNLSGETRQNKENLRIIVIPANIQTEHLPNTSKKIYHLRKGQRGS
jgi:hypothetical protein